MSEIIYGLYEQTINGIINENLNKVDQELVIKDTQPLDSAESSKILADYFISMLSLPLIAVAPKRRNRCHTPISYKRRDKYTLSKIRTDGMVKK